MKGRSSCEILKHKIFAEAIAEIWRCDVLGREAGKRRWLLQRVAMGGFWPQPVPGHCSLSRVWCSLSFWPPSLQIQYSERGTHIYSTSTTAANSPYSWAAAHLSDSIDGICTLRSSSAEEQSWGSPTPLHTAAGAEIPGEPLWSARRWGLEELERSSRLGAPGGLTIQDAFWGTQRGVSGANV